MLPLIVLLPVLYGTGLIRASVRRAGFSFGGAWLHWWGRADWVLHWVRLLGLVLWPVVMLGSWPVGLIGFLCSLWSWRDHRAHCRRLVRFVLQCPTIHPQELHDLYFAGFAPLPWRWSSQPQRVLKAPLVDFRTGNRPRRRLWAVIHASFSMILNVSLYRVAKRDPALSGRAREAFYVLGALWGARVAQVSRLAYRIEDLEQLQVLDGPAVFGFNHTSILDFAIVPHALRLAALSRRDPLQICFLAAKDHLKDNWFNYRVLRIGWVIEDGGFIFVDRRGSPADRQRAVDDAVAQLVRNDDQLLRPKGWGIITKKKLLDPSQAAGQQTPASTASVRRAQAGKLAGEARQTAREFDSARSASEFAPSGFAGGGGRRKPPTIDVGVFSQGARSRRRCNARGEDLEPGYYTVGSRRRLQKSGAHLKKGSARLAVKAAVALGVADDAQPLYVVPVGIIGAGAAFAKGALGIQSESLLTIRVGTPMLVDPHPADVETAVQSVHTYIDRSLRELLAIHPRLMTQMAEGLTASPVAARCRAVRQHLEALPPEETLPFATLDCLFQLPEAQHQTWLERFVETMAGGYERDAMESLYQRIVALL